LDSSIRDSAASTSSIYFVKYNTIYYRDAIHREDIKAEACEADAGSEEGQFHASSWTGEERGFAACKSCCFFGKEWAWANDGVLDWILQDVLETHRESVTASYIYVSGCILGVGEAGEG